MEQIDWYERGRQEMADFLDRLKARGKNLLEEVPRIASEDMAILQSAEERVMRGNWVDEGQEISVRSTVELYRGRLSRLD